MSVSAESFGFVAELVRDQSAIQLHPGKEYLVESRLLPLARARGLSGPSAVDSYVQDVRRTGDKGELIRVIEAMTTNETSWFRDNVPFNNLRHLVLPDVRAHHPGQLRIWSAGCSTGQEPYSIAMTLLDSEERHFAIVASDLSNAVLSRAVAGEYSQLEINRGLPAPMLVRYFERAGAGWVVKPEIKQRISFVQHNLLRPTPAGPFDIVFMRNVLIYFDTATKRDILARLRRAMRPGGYLILGAAESTMGIDDAWERVPASRGPVYRMPGAIS